MFFRLWMVLACMSVGTLFAATDQSLVDEGMAEVVADMSASPAAAPDESADATGVQAPDAAMPDQSTSDATSTDQVTSEDVAAPVQDDSVSAGDVDWGN